MATCLVLGSGVQGLTCALKLHAQGWQVIVLSSGQLRQTTSWGAGAIWEYPPFHVLPEDAAKRWVRASLAPFCDLAENVGHECGVRLRRSYYVFRDASKGRDAFEAAADPPGAVLDLHEGLPPEGALVPGGPHVYGFSYHAPVICMSRYLEWLQESLHKIGVRMQTARFEDLADVADWKKTEQAELVVNCLGIGSGALFHDPAVYGVLGDLVYVRGPDGLEHDLDMAHLSDEDHPGGLTYCVPQLGGTLALAGTAEKATIAQLEQANIPGTAEAEQSEARKELILHRCKEVFSFCQSPDFAILGSWTGLRPQRQGGIRLELEQELGDVGPVIHNYGHGGSGVVTSWGCAEDVAKLALNVAAAANLTLKPSKLPEHLNQVAQSS